MTVVVVEPVAGPIILVEPPVAEPVVVLNPNLGSGGPFGIPRVVTLANVANVYTPDALITDVGLIIDPPANFEIANPIHHVYDEQRLLLKIKSGGTGYTATWDTAYISSGIAPLPFGALPSGKTVTYGFIYDLAATSWVLLAADSTGY